MCVPVPSIDSFIDGNNSTSGVPACLCVCVYISYKLDKNYNSRTKFKMSIYI